MTNTTVSRMATETINSYIGISRTAILRLQCGTMPLGESTAEEEIQLQRDALQVYMDELHGRALEAYRAAHPTPADLLFTKFQQLDLALKRPHRVHLVPGLRDDILKLTAQTPLDQVAEVAQRVREDLRMAHRKLVDYLLDAIDVLK